MGGGQRARGGRGGVWVGVWGVKNNQLVPVSTDRKALTTAGKVASHTTMTAYAHGSGDQAVDL